MTNEQKTRLNSLTEQYRFCFIVQGYFHAAHNDKRMERFIKEKMPQKYEFIRITADMTYVFWNPQTTERKGL